MLFFTTLCSPIPMFCDLVNDAEMDVFREEQKEQGK